MSKCDEDYFPLYRCKITGKLFENPKNFTFHIKEWNDKNHINIAFDIKENHV